jgi:hypothetical protein
LERHVALLENIMRLWGGLAMLVGAALLLIAAGALAQLMDSAGDSVGLAAGLTASMFTLLGTFALVWGALHVWAASLLARRRQMGRVLTLALSVTNLPVLPFGTALGIYALWILLKNEGRRLFVT